MGEIHAYSAALAKKYGSIRVAVFLNHFAHWHKNNIKLPENCFDGCVWVRLKASQLQNRYDYLTFRQIRTTIKKMVDLDLLNEGEFNDQKNDRTKWYSLTEKALLALGLPSLNEGYKNVTCTGYKNVSSSGYKNVTSINKEVIKKSNYTQVGETAFDFLKIENAFEMEQWEMNAKRQIDNWDLFLVNFNCKVDEEGLEYSFKTLFSRLNRMKANWINNRKKENNVRRLDPAFNSPGPKVMHY